mmetsp:Transcript_50667/g.133831  ORF Transcript_50667/g.133831 Transcript_50667/m.133831 type:complete len:218 (+) Transcript_50667:489-1142(+)
MVPPASRSRKGHGGRGARRERACDVQSGRVPLGPCRTSITGPPGRPTARSAATRAGRPRSRPRGPAASPRATTPSHLPARTRTCTSACRHGTAGRARRPAPSGCPWCTSPWRSRRPSGTWKAQRTPPSPHPTASAAPSTPRRRPRRGLPWARARASAASSTLPWAPWTARTSSAAPGLPWGCTAQGRPPRQPGSGRSRASAERRAAAGPGRAAACTL